MAALTVSRLVFLYVPSASGGSSWLKGYGHLLKTPENEKATALDRWTEENTRIVSA